MKARIALEAIKEQKTIQEIASHYGVHPSQVTNWKRQAIHSVSRLPERTTSSLCSNGKMPTAAAPTFLVSSRRCQLSFSFAGESGWMLRISLCAESKRSRPRTLIKYDEYDVQAAPGLWVTEIR